MCSDIFLSWPHNLIVLGCHHPNRSSWSVTVIGFCHHLVTPTQYILGSHNQGVIFRWQKNLIVFTVVTQICHLPHKQGLVIWQYWTPTNREQTNFVIIVAVANEFVALNDNWKGNFGTCREFDLKMSRWHSTVACVGFSFKVYSFKLWSNMGAML